MITEQQVETALITWFRNEISWDKGMAPWTADQFRVEMRATLEAALQSAADTPAPTPPETPSDATEAIELARINAALGAIRSTCSTMESDDRHLIGLGTIAQLRDAAKLINELVFQSASQPAPQTHEQPCSVCGNEERGQGGYLSCECPAAQPKMLFIEESNPPIQM